MCDSVCIAKWGRLVLLSAAFLTTGCSESSENVSRLAQGSESNVMSRRYPGIPAGAIRSAADRAFRARFALNHEVSGPNLWVSVPSEMSSDDKRDSSIMLRTGQRHQRIAELQLLPDAAGVIVRCQVRIERLDTLERTSFARQRGDDRPSDTPIDTMSGGASPSKEQWTVVARDRRAEQELIAEITAEAETNP